MSASASSSHDWHTAMFYAGPEDFVRKLVPFLRDGVEAGEPTLVALQEDRIDRLRDALGDDAANVAFAEVGEVGANPARIIPAWQEFVAAHPGRRVRGVGEPIVPERRGPELLECQHHERLLNPAMAGSDLTLVCPYDTEALSGEVIAEAQRSHPLVEDSAGAGRSGDYAGLASAGAFFGQPLAEPDTEPEEIGFAVGSLRSVRGLVTRHAQRCGLDPGRTLELVQAVSELAANSIRHGGGSGTLRVWRDGDTVICEVRDGGRIDNPLVDRRRPVEGQIGGWGLWLANQLCDLLQLRSLPEGTVARSHMRLTPRTATAG